ncbi:MAG: DUF501 domain-containing protein [Actinomycetota bacterium]|nr:DUF501 domain-containing protein [Actinomycetota bacterium]
MTSWPEPAPADAEAVARLLAREPEGPYAVVVRRADTGLPAVIACWPFMGGVTPMPTLFWLLDPTLAREVSVVESGGAVRQARSAVDGADLAEAHRRYASLRDSLVPSGHGGARPSGGIGGTRQGVKCLHAHMAWHLVGGGDPVITWALETFPGAFSLAGLDVGPFPRGLESLQPLRSGVEAS